ncbi:MAG TPA: alpha-amylase family glycosyl hydrolase, partial [Bacillota bacterium]|nr:alpha-amylase family glycosyl hydrolase [Bacillota bacterium]
MKRTFTIILIIIGISFSTVVSADDINLQDEVIYNIIIDRFNNGDQSLSDHVQVDDPYNYHGGDFVGITKKLDDLEALGFSTIVLSPIMDNASAGFHGYWVEDFFKLNENYGTEEEFKQLVEEAHERGMKVAVELVFNYAALTNPLVTDPDTKHWFQEKTFTPNENEESLFWLQDVVQFDQQNESVQEYLLDVTAYWMDEVDIDGFKLHAADQADEIFLQKLTSFIKERDPKLFLLANVLDVDSDIEWLQEMETIDAVENHQMFDSLIDVFSEVGTPVEKLFDQWQAIGHEKDLIFTETKDTARFANAVALNDRNALTTWTLALTYLYTAPGIPYMYQGNELQMFGLEFPETQQMMRFNSTEPDLEEFHNKLSTMLEEYPVLTAG